MKRIIMLVLTVSLLLSLASPINAATTVKKEDPFGKYAKPLKVTANAVFAPWMALDPGNDQNNNFWTRLYKDKLNIDFSFKWTSSDWGTEFDQKFNLSLASGDMPDIMYAYSSLAVKAIKANRVWDLTNVYNTYASDLVKKFYKADPNSMKAWNIGGKQVALSKNLRKYPTRYGYWVRKDWLDQLKLSVPKTFTEVEKVMKAFKDANPGKQNGNYGFALNGPYGGPLYTMNPAFGMTNGTWALYGDKLLHKFTDPRVIKLWSKYASWYKSGIIAKDFILKKDDPDTLQDWINGKVGVIWGTPSDHNAAFIRELKKKNDNMSVVYVPMTTVNGKSVMYEEDASYGDAIFVNKSFKNPEALIKILNLGTQVFSNDKPSYIKDTEYVNGKAGGWANFFVCFAYLESPAEQVAQRQNALTAFKTGNPSKLDLNSKGIFYDKLVAYRDKEKNDPAYLDNWVNYMNIGPNGTQTDSDKLDKAGKDYKYSPFWASETETTARNSQNWKQKFEEFRAEAIIKGNVKEAFNKWMDFFKANNGQKATDEVNEWYKVNK